jgi:hypothetical protein
MLITLYIFGGRPEGNEMQLSRTDKLYEMLTDVLPKKL